MPPTVNDQVAWSVGLSVSLSSVGSPVENSEAIEIPFAFRTGGPRERPIAYSVPLRANTVLCSFNKIQPSTSKF